MGPTRVLTMSFLSIFYNVMNSYYAIITIITIYIPQDPLQHTVKDLFFRTLYYSFLVYPDRLVRGLRPIFAGWTL